MALGANLIIEALNLIENKKIILKIRMTKMQHAKKLRKMNLKLIGMTKQKRLLLKLMPHPNPGTWFMHNDGRHKIIKG